MGQARNQEGYAQGQQYPAAERAPGSIQQSPRDKSSFGTELKGMVTDKDYNLISVLYHALQGAETSGKYIQDAEKAGDEELVKFFHEVHLQELELANRAKQFLGSRFSGHHEPDQQRARS